MSKSNKFVFQALNVVSWIIFVGLCIEAGALVVMTTHNLQLLREFPGKVYRCADHLMTDVTAEYAPAITND